MSIIADAEGRDAASRGGVRWQRGERGGGGLRNGGQGGWGAQQHRPGKQHWDDKIRQQTRTVGWRIALFRGQFCQTEPILMANRLTDSPLPRPDCPAVDESSWKNINQIN